jgi:HD-like signal output (HDOD) protein
MKNWINRLLAGANDRASAVAAGDDGEQPDGQATDLTLEIDARYYRWLTSSACYFAPADTESRILDDIRSLSDSPGEAADLVPRVPEVIPQLLRSLDGEDSSPAELSRQVSQDVVLTAEVLREANSAYYRPIDPVQSVEAAIVMLGQNGLRMLLARLAFRPIIQMQPGGFARRVAPHLWSQSEKCALAASLLAPGLTAGVFESYLAGLMQNVGLVVAFRLADRLCKDGKVPRSDEFGVKLLAASRHLSAGIARHWDFPQDVAEAIAQAGEPGDSKLAQALATGDRIAKLRLLIDGYVLTPEDSLVTKGLDPFQRRCLGKLTKLDG